MLKKRIIFTLLYNEGNFMLSRNFRLQKVGDIKWLQKNYNFSQVAFSIDELIILDVSRSKRNNTDFYNSIKMIAKECFIPISAGGGVDSIEKALELLRSGADKIVINSIVADNSEMIREISSVLGRQCLVVSVDVKKIDGKLVIFTNNGNKQENSNLIEWLEKISRLPVGELYLNSIDRDGTGQGYLMELLDSIPDNWNIPIIMAGGAGNYIHLAEGLSDDRINAVATAHLFNFVGDGLECARAKLLSNGMDLVRWDKECIVHLKNFFNFNHEISTK